MSRRSPAWTKELGDEQIALVAKLFAVLADPTRLRIIRALGSGPQNVTQLVTATGLRQANVSKHLGMLLQAGLLERRQVANTAEYAISDQTVPELCSMVYGTIKQRTVRQYKSFR